MSAKRRRAKAERNRRAFPLTTALLSSEWVTSGRIACSYGSHDGNPCGRCGAVYAGPPEPVQRFTYHGDDGHLFRPDWLDTWVCEVCGDEIADHEERPAPAPKRAGS